MSEEIKDLTQENSEIQKDEYIPDELSFDELQEENVPEEEADKPDVKRNFLKEVYEWISSIAIAVVLALIINTFLFSLVQVDGQSMVPTLQHGERLLVRKILYTPENSDVVIVKSNVLQKYIVKRVVASPGQEVSFDMMKNLIVDGDTKTEDYINELQQNTGGLYNYPLVVPKEGEIAELYLIIAESLTLPQVKIEQENGKIMITGSRFVDDGEFIFGQTKYTGNGYFVMGDNRNYSSDSRNLGIIPEDEIIGEAILRFLPISAFGLIK